ncbi:MAG: hypothetical protein HY720_23510 [Planctomycetes bacterium]|nr:hypothetical protein [Planctomycetota bacterium]
MKTLRVHKIASVTYRLAIEREVELLEEGVPEVGNVVVVQALEEKRVYSELELATGRMAKILKGDVLVGALGARMALKGFVGRVPKRLAPGDRLHILNMGGVVGECTSAGGDIGRALETRFLGMAMKDGRVRNIREGAIPERERLDDPPPLILVGGSCMSSGKTQAACETIAGLTARGLRVGAGKVSGVACLRDQLNMLDHGAVAAMSFLDCGHPSTARMDSVVGIAKGVIGALKEEANPDAIVLELGDGVIGGYGVSSLYADDELRAATALHVFCANDLVAAWGGQSYLARMGVAISILSGPVTDNEVGVDYGERELHVPSANARTEPERLVGLVVQALSRARRMGTRKIKVAEP